MNSCLNCGKPVKNKFCNVSCQNKVQKKSPAKENIQKGIIKRFGNFIIIIKNCPKCGKEFEITKRENSINKKEKQ